MSHLSSWLSVQVRKETLQWSAVHAVQWSGVEWMKGKHSEDKEMEYDREQKGRT